MIDDWRGLYRKGWNGNLTPEALSVLSNHVTPMTKGDKIRSNTGIRFSAKQSRRDYMMNVQFFAKFILGYAAIEAFIILFPSDNPSNFSPSRSVWCPSALPGGVIFAAPISRFPRAKARAIAEKIVLTALVPFFHLPCRYIFLTPAISTNNSNEFCPIRPSLFKFVFHQARPGAIVRIANLFILKKEWLSTIGALCLYPLWLAWFYARRNIFAAARCGTEITIACREIDYIRLYKKWLSTICAIYLDHVIPPYKGCHYA